MARMDYEYDTNSVCGSVVNFTVSRNYVGVYSGSTTMAISCPITRAKMRDAMVVLFPPSVGDSEIYVNGVNLLSPDFDSDNPIVQGSKIAAVAVYAGLVV